MNMKKMMKKFVKGTKAVSPLVATLMLVLVAVGGAGAFYMWQTGWQENAEANAGDADVKATLTIGGSSTVYEFTKVAKEMFEGVHSNYKIDLQSGGSLSGIMSAGYGLVDIGAASKNIDDYLSYYPDLNRDGSKDLGQPDLVSHLVGYDGIVIILADGPISENITSMHKNTVRDIYDGDLEYWGEIPIAAGSTTTLGDVDAAYDTIEINVYDRAEGSGTEASFRKYYSDGSESDLDSVTGAGVDTGVTSNQQLLDTLEGDPYGISFMSYGIAYNDDAVKVLGIDFGRTGGVEIPTFESIATEEYKAGRPLNLITIGEPTGAAKLFIDFCLTANNNQEMCELSNYISIYHSGLDPA